MLWKLNRREEALERAARAVRQDPGLQWVWNAISRWAAELKKPNYAIDLARELTVSRAGEARSWLVLAGMLSEKAQVDERLAALDRAVALNPRLIEAHDQRAWVLHDAQRNEEALAACRPAIWGETPPIRLRGRAAWIAAETGDITGAITAMRQVVAEDPHYYWGWSRLATWYRQTRDYTQFLSTAQTLVSQWPLDAVSRGFLGQALRFTKDPKGAKEAFADALRLDPDNEYAATSLFDMAIDDEDVAEAAKALTFVQRHGRDAATIARECRLATARRDHPAALNLFSELCRHERADRGLLDWVIKPLAPMAGEGTVNRTLRALATEPQTRRAAVARLLIDRLVKAKHFREGELLVEELVAVGGDFAHEAAQAWLSGLGTSVNETLLKRFVHKHRKFLRENDVDWGTAGYAMHCAHRHRQVISWMADWKERKGTAAWMLVNLAQSYRALKEDAESHAIHVFAEALPAPGFEQPRSIHRLWLAADAARDGHHDSAAALLAKVKMDSLHRDYQFLRKVVDAMMIALRPPAPGSFASIRQTLAAARKIHPKFGKDRELKRIYLQALRTISPRGGGFGARWWCFWHRVSVQ